MKAICGSTDLSAYIGYGYTVEYEPQYGGSVTTMDGKDHTAKIRDRAKLTVPFIPLTAAELSTVLQLFPASGPYVTWTYTDPKSNQDRTVDMKYETRTSSIKVHYHNGTEYWDGLVVRLTER